MGAHVALLRGINVGRAKQVPMAALAEVFVEAGYRDVRTVLRSGNVAFSADGPLRDGAAARLETAVETATGVSSSVLLLTARQLHLVAAQNPLLDVGTDPSRLFVGFTSAPPAPGSSPPPPTWHPRCWWWGSGPFTSGAPTASRPAGCRRRSGARWPPS